jgi:uncharacterized UBP type Zn finger protein
MLQHYIRCRAADDGSHVLCINLRTGVVWCYLCDNEVVENSHNPQLEQNLGLLREPLFESKENGHAEPKAKARPPGGTAITFSGALVTSIAGLGVCGITNLGNTCYLNAAVQCMNHCQPLTSYFQLYFRPFLARRTTTRSHPLSRTFAALVGELWSGKQYVLWRYYSSQKCSAAIRPVEFVREIKRINPLFRGYAQQVSFWIHSIVPNDLKDSQEFLRCTLDRLHEELKEDGPTNGTKSQAVSPISLLYEGTLLSRVKCLRCGKVLEDARSILTCLQVSSTNDPFYDLSLSIPDDAMLSRLAKEGIGSSSSPLPPTRSSLFSRVGSWLMYCDGSSFDSCGLMLAW